MEAFGFNNEVLMVEDFSDNESDLPSFNDPRSKITEIKNI